MRYGQNLPHVQALKRFCRRFNLQQIPVGFQCGGVTGWYLHSKKPVAYDTQGYNYREHQFHLKPIGDCEEQRHVLVLEIIPEANGAESQFFLFTYDQIPVRQYITIPVDSRSVQDRKFREVLLRKVTESQLTERFAQWSDIQRAIEDCQTKIQKLQKRVVELQSKLPAPTAESA